MNSIDLQRLFSKRSKRTQSVMTAPEPEWREGLRDTGLMLSGIYQDLRGDLAGSATDFGKWVRAGWRKMWSGRLG